jgi:NAD(P)-dependent dehydrogenase (short-subunit alcohol dehydrogenase family)
MRIDKNFVAVVTGGSSGLGEATVKHFANLGAKVVVADLNEEQGQEVAKQTGSVFFKTNVTNEENVEALFAFARKTFGRVSAVINCAGVVTAGTIIYSKGTASTSEMERLLKINVVGTFNVAKFAAKAMS